MKLKNIIENPVHVKCEDEHYLHFTYNPKKVSCFFTFGIFKELLKFYHINEEKVSLVAVVLGKKLNKNEVFKTSKGFVKFRDVESLDFECAKRFVTNTKYLKKFKKFAKGEQNIYFECARRFLMRDQKLPVILDNIPYPERKLGIIKSLETILQRKPYLEDYANKCGVY